MKPFLAGPTALTTSSADVVTADTTGARIGNIVVANTTSGALTVTIYLKPTAATSNADGLALCKALSVGANTTNTSLQNIVIPKNYVISALASGAGLSFTYTGTIER